MWVKGVFCIDKQCRAARELHLGYGMEGERSLARSLATIDFYDAASRITTDA